MATTTANSIDMSPPIQNLSCNTTDYNYENTGSYEQLRVRISPDVNRCHPVHRYLPLAILRAW